MERLRDKKGGYDIMRTMARKRGRAMKPREVAEELGVNPRTVVRWIHKGALPGFKAGKAWRVWRADLDEFVDRKAA